jgi:LysM repeat protein
MVQITHQTARTLLQAAADKTLASEEQLALDTHLAGCQDCRAYADGLSQLQADLRRLTHLQWDVQHPSLDIRTIQKRAIKGTQQEIGFRTIGRLAIAMALVCAFFVASSLMGHFSGKLNLGDVSVPLPELTVATATPTAQPTTATLYPAMTAECQTVIYAVQPDDTLESIAARYGVTKQTILNYNTLQSETLNTSMKLLIPVCSGTPSDTVTPTNTSTPMSALIRYATPG